jgi:hypothetical protein
MFSVFISGCALRRVCSGWALKSVCSGRTLKRFKDITNAFTLVRQTKLGAFIRVKAPVG